MSKEIGVGICPRCKTPSVWEVDIYKDTFWTCCGVVIYKLKPLDKVGYKYIGAGVR